MWSTQDIEASRDSSITPTPGIGSTESIVMYVVGSRESMYSAYVRWSMELRLTSHTVRSDRSADHTSQLQSLMRISYAVFCLKNKNKAHMTINNTEHIKIDTIRTPYKYN